MYTALVFFLTAALAYLAGSLAPAWFAGKARSVDLRFEGRETLDFLNAWEVLGRGPGALVFAADALRALVVVWLALRLTGSAWGGAVAGFAVVAGAVWPLFHGFAGGRGVAPLVGVLVAASPWTLLITVTLLILIAALTGMLEHAELLSLVMMPAVAVLVGGGDIPLMFLTLALAALMVHVRWTLVEILLGARKEEKKEES